MKCLILKDLDFRSEKYKAKDKKIVEIPDGLANKLILDGVVSKATTAVEKTKKAKASK